MMNQAIISSNAVSVSDLNKYIKDKFDSDENLEQLIIKGEISNFKNHYSGHLYFSLKDDKAIIKGVMFKNDALRLNFMPKDGMKVFIIGRVGVFERDGVYQIYANQMFQDGLGDLFKAYEELKKKLDDEGLFDESHKKKIPFMPKIIGVLTSNTGAVIRDIINVSTRRNPNVYIRLLPVPVQGQGAGEKIAKAIKYMNDEKLADVLIIGRGGGSLEDLWPFNEEVVARAIYASEIPIISAVGHETDFTIADFVADLRAPTPSAAAELAVADIETLKYNIRNYQNNLKLFLKKKTELMRLRYEKCLNSKVFKEPYQKINDNRLLIDSYSRTILNDLEKKIKDSKLEASKYITKLDTLSPLKTLTRGYTLTEVDGKLITKAEDLKKDQEFDLRFQDGKIKAKVI